MEEKETILKEIVGDIICAVISIYLLNMMLTNMFSRFQDIIISIIERMA